MTVTTSARTVVVTGASAGTGRAIATEFAGRGARVALLARGRAGLEAAAADVARAGGQPLVIPADVANYDEIDAAAQRVEDEFGPLDVWVNVAFTSVFAPFCQITPDEFRRVTEVTYLGFVYGTMAALRRMRGRDRGTIVQVGSALGERAIPLQSAYCGAKHAVKGFTESLRTELMHDHSNVHVTLVQMPALNTPQFSWVRSRLPLQAQPVPPIYQPEIAARAVVYAAEHPTHKQYWVGASTVATLLGQRLAPALLDRYLARTGYSSQQTDRPKPESADDNLWRPLDDAPGHDHGSHGIFDEAAHPTSRQWWLRRHATPLLAAATAMVAGAVGAGVIRAGWRWGAAIG